MTCDNEVPVPETRVPVRRRQFLAFLVAAPVLTVAVPGTAEAVVPTLPQPAEIMDLGDILILAGTPTEGALAVLSVGEDGVVTLELPRAEVGQGITTATAMLVAEELDLPLDRVRVVLADARSELLFNQLTGGSNTIRSVYGPVRSAAAAVRARLVAAAAQEYGVAVGQLSTRDGGVVLPDGRFIAYGLLTSAAAQLTGVFSAQPKPASEHRLVGTPQSRIDARAMVTGQFKYTLDHDVPGAMPTVVRRAPTINGTVRSVDSAVARSMPGVLAVGVVPTGVAVVAETFGRRWPLGTR